MAKTIEEMAKEAVEIKHVEWSYKNMARGWYEEGANAVLEELEYMLRHHYTTFNATATDVLNKIKQLKG